MLEGGGLQIFEGPAVQSHGAPTSHSLVLIALYHLWCTYTSWQWKKDIMYVWCAEILVTQGRSNKRILWVGCKIKILWEDWEFLSLMIGKILTLAYIGKCQYFTAEAPMMRSPKMFVLSGLCCSISRGLSIDEEGGFKIFATWARASPNWWAFICKVACCREHNCRVHRLSGVASLIDELGRIGEKKHYQQVDPHSAYLAVCIGGRGAEIFAIQLHWLSFWMPSGAPDERSARPLNGTMKDQLQEWSILAADALELSGDVGNPLS